MTCANDTRSIAVRFISQNDNIECMTMKFLIVTIRMNNYCDKVYNKNFAYFTYGGRVSIIGSNRLFNCFIYL